jgi:hypothetical protein
MIKRSGSAYNHALLLMVPCLATIFIGYLGIRKASAERALRYLVACTALFGLTMLIPIFLWGGSHHSCFGALLVTVTGLIVVVTKSSRIRWSFALSCIIAYAVLAFKFEGITIEPGVVYALNGYEITGEHLHTIFQTLSVILCLGVTLRLSWKGEFLLEKPANGGPAAPVSTDPSNG